RVAHTLKGAARVVKQTEIANRAHAIEDTLASFRETGVVGRPAIDAILSDIDDIGEHLRALSSPAESDAAENTPAAAPREDVQRTLRADISEMDALLEGVSETHALLNRLRVSLADIEDARELADLLLAHLGPRGGGEPRRQVAPERLLSIAQELRRKFG